MRTPRPLEMSIIAWRVICSGRVALVMRWRFERVSNTTTTVLAATKTVPCAENCESA